MYNNQFTTTEDGDLNICDTLLVITEPRPDCVLPMQEQFSKHASDIGRPRARCSGQQHYTFL